MNKLICLESVDSTNAYLRRSADELPHGTVVLADAQTAGRGRLGRSFASLAGKGIYLSVLLRPDCDPVRCASLTPAAAVAVCRAVKRICGVEPEIKWVNDLFLGGKKICGMLIENVLCGDCVAYSIIGLGININNDLPDELKDIATSLKKEGFAVDFESVLSTLIFNLSGQSSIGDYIRYSLVIGKKLTVTQGDKTFECVASGIDERGALILSDGRKLNSAEVKIVGIGD